MKRLLFALIALPAVFCVAGPVVAESVDTMSKRVLPCTACHGKEGRATAEGYFPRIAGKPAGYLYHQLVNFRDGRRHYPQMVTLVEHLTDDYLRDMARHFAAIDLPYPPPAPAAAPTAVLERGERLVRQGDRTRDLPACASCHGERLLGVAPYVPGLLGLSRDYLYGQLGFWRNGERRAHAPDCMADIVKRMTADDVSAVSAWLAAQPVPVSAKPATAFASEPPLKCGSIRP